MTQPVLPIDAFRRDDSRHRPRIRSARRFRAVIAGVGELALLAALALAAFQATVPLLGAARGGRRTMAAGGFAAVGQAACLAVAFAALVHAFATSDFSLEVVHRNSHSLKPMLYKLSGTWGNHEGSMLMWVLVLALFGAAIALFARSLPPALKARTLAVQGMIGCAFLAFVALTSNPFSRLVPPPPDGRGLNPLLQDPGLAFHPPLLYVGYVGFSVAFSFAVAALLEGRSGTAWVRHARPWIVAAWTSLTAGIALGSWWAYYELGWGGWWFWDPVENASFMPWLLGTALLHSAVVAERRGALGSWVLLLAILTFSLSLLGTFLVRSGILTSVHAFANDPDRGIFVLVILAAAVGGALALYAARAPRLGDRAAFAPVSREGALLANNLVLALAAGTVLLGTLYPLILDALSGGEVRVSVGPPYFNATFVPIMVPLLLLVAVGPLLSWRRGDARAALRRLRPAAAAAAAAAAAVLAVRPDGPVLAVPAMGAAAWIAAAAVAERAGRGAFARPAGRAAGAGTRPRRTARWRPRRADGMTLAHLGLAVMIVGVTGSSAWRSELVAELAVGESARSGAYTVTLEDVSLGAGPNYVRERGRLAVADGDGRVATLAPERRHYPVAGQTTTEAGIRTTWFADFYGVIGKRAAAGTEGGWTVRFYVNPFMAWLWAGALLMTLGGLVALAGSGAPRRPRTAPADGR